MLEELLPYYERELGFLRDLSGDFARRYPKIARRLLIDGDQCADPHVERMIEAFALLSARVHRKLDDEYPEITESFMQVMYPHYIRPFPSCTIVELQTDHAKPASTLAVAVPRHHRLTTPAVGNHRCEFRTAYPVDLLPLQVSQARLQLTSSSDHLRLQAPGARAVLSLQLQCDPGANLQQLQLQKVRFFLDGDPALMHLLHDLLTVKVQAVRRVLPKGHIAGMRIEAVGFAEDEALLDYEERSFAGYRLLTEYFAFPEKFMFVDLLGLDALTFADTDTVLDLQILLSANGSGERSQRLMESLGPDNFRLGCTPAVNLFRQAAEPIRLTHHQDRYPVSVNSRRAMAYEVIGVESVRHVQKQGSAQETQPVPPFFSLDHHHSEAGPRFYWSQSRERSIREHDAGTELYISIVDLEFRPGRPEWEVLSLELTCSNRDLPEQLPFGGSEGGTHSDFQAPQLPMVQRCRVLRKPSRSVRPPAKRGLQWRLVSHLSLNHLSIVSQGTDALRELLTLYNQSESPAMARQVHGIADIRSQPAVTRASGPHFSGFVRGTDITLTLDPQFFVGASATLFASVLERFFALYAGANSFSRLTLRDPQLQQDIATWPARVGEALVI